MIAYKGFHPGMVCIGYQFQMGLNVTQEANCRKNGFLVAAAGRSATARSPASHHPASLCSCVNAVSIPRL